MRAFHGWHKTKSKTCKRPLDMVLTAQRTITPLIGALLVLIPLSFYPALRDPALGPKLLVFQSLVTLALCIWLFTRQFYFHPIVLPALAYVSFTLLSAMYATNPTLALLESTKQLTGFLFFLFCANHLKTKKLIPILQASLAAGILIALLGIGDYLGWRPFHIPSSGLPSATLGFRNIAAMYLIQSLPFAVALFALTDAHKTRYFTGFAIALMGAFLIYTRTRGAWLGIAVASLITCVLWWQHKDFTTEWADKKSPILLALALFVPIAILPANLSKQGPQSIDEKKTTVQATLTSVLDEGGDRGRLSTWRLTLPMIADHPIGGVGQGNWQIYYPLYDQGTNITFGTAPERPHNNWLQILSETGAVGFLLYTCFCFMVLYSGWRLLKLPNRVIRWIAAACLTSFIAILIHSFFSFPAERVTPTVFFWFASGIIAALSHPKHPSRPPIIRPIVAGLIVVSLIQIAFTYRVIQFDKHMYRAVKAEYEGDWQTVINTIESTQQNGTFHREAIHLYGYALNQQGFYTKAIGHYQQARTQSPYDIQIINGLAIAHQNLGQQSQAETYYLQALELVESTDIRYNLAGLYFQSGRAGQAAIEYSRIAQIENPSLDLYYHLIHAYLFSRQNDRAPEVMQRTLKLSSKVSDHINWIDRLYQRHRKSEVAQACYTLLISQWTGSPTQIEPARRRLQQLKALP